MEKTIIPYARQSVSQEDIQSVVDVLRSDWLTQGPAVERFERAVADYCGVRHAVAVNSATSALHIACLAAGLGSGDRGWTSPNTFVASANCFLYCGARPDFVDIDSDTYNMSVSELGKRLQAADRAGMLPKVLIPVHFAGQSCEMQAMAELARRYKVTVIEDASHGVGGRYRGTPVGSCTYSDMAVFSFHPVKIITTGEGGMILTNRDDLRDKLVRLRSHGITRDPVCMQGENHGAWYYQQIELGFNYRITDFQAALGTSQMQQLKSFVGRRRTIAERYDRELGSLPVIRPKQHDDMESAWHLYVIQVDPDRTGVSRKELFDGLRTAGILVNVHYIPVHLQPYYRTMGFRPGYCPAAEQYYERAISLPMYPGLTDVMQTTVIATIRSLLEER